ncbi:ATP-dependent helicase HrpB [Acetonema longum DSM 6540]|uniref:ATP-dependent helicase HrpB n=2 Tax=Acetonema TaxID=2373 RepID=F7NP00_9FIRM|nr:ATP-dependent helicase HrpB [Acetonema longum DSM 6540]
MLEPRRLAARAAARYMAACLGEPVGETVGYRVRLETRVSSRTRIEVVTEGVLTRLLQADPALTDTGIVIFDEFHERSLQADLGLALCLQAQEVLRPDLRLLVMSATLDAQPVAALMGGAAVLASQGRSFPTETIYCKDKIEGRIEPAVAHTVIEALSRHSGDVLVFLPGEAEIRRVQARLREIGLGPDVRLAPLYGNLPSAAQDLALLPCPAGERKVVLATAIAETSLTVEGVQVVVDSGLMRVPRFSPRTGMTRLETIGVSRAAADQRRGRAGRLGPGVCYRLWTKEADARLESSAKPEILEADLAPLALELAAWGAAEPEILRWLDTPPAGAFSQARQLLRRLGVLDAQGAITSHGQSIAEHGLHPRLAHMILTAIPHGLGSLACELAALLNGRDVFGRTGQPDADLRLRLEAVRRFKGKEGAGRDSGEMEAGQRRVLAEIRYWRRKFAIPAAEQADISACGAVLAMAYPDRIGQKRENDRFLLSNGRGAYFASIQPLSQAAWLVAAELDDQGPESRILLAAPVELVDLHRYFAGVIREVTSIVWDRTVQAVRARQEVRLGALVLKDILPDRPEPAAVQTALLQGISQEGLAILPWTKTACQYRQRLQFMHYQDPSWPDVSDAALESALADWLGPYVYGMSKASDLQRLNLTAILENLLTWEQRRELEEAAPARMEVPSGQKIAVDYSDPACPVMAVKLQELFGLAETPHLGGGKVPLTLHLLSPAQRPVQVTRDLASFWRETYFAVKKDLMGRYPKHYWPEDPWKAVPTHRTRPRGDR